MGRTVLDHAMRDNPELCTRLAAAEQELTRVIALLEPYARRGGVPDPDIVFQVKILQQALQEITWMLHPASA